MQVGKRHHWNRGRARRAAVVVPLLVAMVLSTLGAAIPLRPSKGIGTPFPCQHHNCGCETAVQCREACCCFTPAEQQAWAHQHGLSEFAPAEVDGLVLGETAGYAVGALCHDAAAELACADSSKTACHAHASGCGQCAESKAKSTPPPCSAWVPRKCRGLTPLWTMLGEVVPFHRGVEWRYAWDSAGRLQCAAATRIKMSFPPPVPPPRG